MVLRFIVFGILMIFVDGCKSIPTQSNTTLQILSNESFQKQIKRKDVYIHQQDQTLLIKDAYVRQDTLYAITERTLTPEEATIVRNPVKSQDRYEHRNDVHIYVKDSADLSSSEKVIPLMSVQSITNNKTKDGMPASSNDTAGVFLLVLVIVVVIAAVLLGILLLMALFSSIFSGGF